MLIWASSDSNKQGQLLRVGCDVPSCEMVSLTKFKLSLKAKPEIFISV